MPDNAGSALDAREPSLATVHTALQRAVVLLERIQIDSPLLVAELLDLVFIALYELERDGLATAQTAS